MRNSKYSGENPLKETNIDKYCRSVESLLNGINSRKRDNKTSKFHFNDFYNEHDHKDDSVPPPDVSCLLE